VSTPGDPDTPGRSSTAYRQLLWDQMYVVWVHLKKVEPSCPGADKSGSCLLDQQPHYASYVSIRKVDIDFRSEHL
jgi:hypothetical protein